MSLLHLRTPGPILDLRRLGHPLVGQALRDRGAQQVRVDALRDTGLFGYFFDDLLDAPLRATSFPPREGGITRERLMPRPEGRGCIRQPGAGSTAASG